MPYKRRILTELKECEVCNSLIERPYKMTLSMWDKRKCCSQKCSGISKRGKELKANKGKIPWNKGKPTPYLLGNKHAKGYKHTDEAKENMSIKRSNEKHWAWKGDDASYSAIHKWLVKNYGPANRCENLNGCPGKSSIFQYALKHDEKYIHKRESYGMLCVSCHKYYDTRLNKINVRL
jgi:hypothetical protein